MIEITRLYGPPDAEELDTTLADAVDRLDDYICEPATVTIQEWSVVDPIDHLPDAGRIVDWLDDEIADQVPDDRLGCPDTDEIRDAIERMRTTVASHITWRMADQQVAMHTVEWDSDGEITVDGRPLSEVRAETAETSR